MSSFEKKTTSMKTGGSVLTERTEQVKGTEIILELLKNGDHFPDVHGN